MRYIENGKIKLDGSIKECDLEEKLLRALEIIVDYSVDMGYLADCKSYDEYNHRMCQRYWFDFHDFNEKPPYKAIGQEQFDLLKEIAQ